jgi:hypothetical protein
MTIGNVEVLEGLEKISRAETVHTAALYDGRLDGQEKTEL